MGGAHETPFSVQLHWLEFPVTLYVVLGVMGVPPAVQLQSEQFPLTLYVVGGVYTTPVSLQEQERSAAEQFPELVHGPKGSVMLPSHALHAHAP